MSVATTLAALNTECIELAPEPVYTDASWVSSYEIDPFTVPAADKIAVPPKAGIWCATGYSSAIS